MKGVPRDFIVSGAFPSGRLSRNAPVGVRYATVIATRLEEAMAGRTKSGLAEEIGIARSTLHDVLTGRSWPDLQTLASLEVALETCLWPTAQAIEVRR